MISQAPARFVPMAQLGREGIQLFEPSRSSQSDEQSPYFRMRQGAKTRGISHPTKPASGKTISETLFDTRSVLKIKANEVAMHLEAGWREQLFRQLDALHDPDEWDERDRPTEIGSFVTFLRLMLHMRPDRKPGIGLSNSGHIVTAWAHEKDRLTIECLLNDQVRWTMVRWVEDDRESAAGSTSLRRLNSALAPYDPATWFDK